MYDEPVFCFKGRVGLSLGILYLSIIHFDEDSEKAE
jgi:hypothetical protein